MSVIELLLIITSLLLLALGFLRGPRPDWIHWIPAFSTPVMLLHLGVDGYRILLIPMYLVLLGAMLSSVTVLLGEADREDTGSVPGVGRRIASGVGMAAVVTGAVASVVFTPVTIVQADVARFLIPERARNLDRLDWVTAHDSVIGILRRTYPFTDHKRINWDSLRASTLPWVAAAQARADAEAYRDGTRALIEAIPDPQVTLTLPAFLNSRVLSVADSHPVSFRIGEDSLGYLRIRRFKPSLRQWLPASAVRRAARAFRDAGVLGVVIDLRAVPVGRSRKLVAGYAAPFLERGAFVEDVSVYRPGLERFEIDPHRRLTASGGRVWPGALVVLVDETCHGSCEMLASILQRERGAIVVGGGEATVGSVGLQGGLVRLPIGMLLRYPVGRSLDQDGVIQLERDWEGKGGVVPDHVVEQPGDTQAGDPLLEQARRTLRGGSAG